MLPWIQGVITKERAASAVLKIRIPYESGERLLEKRPRIKEDDFTCPPDDSSVWTCTIGFLSRKVACRD